MIIRVGFILLHAVALHLLLRMLLISLERGNWDAVYILALLVFLIARGLWKE